MKKAQKRRLPSDGAKKKKRKTRQRLEEVEIVPKDLLPTRESIARQLLVAARAKKMALLEGTIGSGKSFLSEYVATALKLQLKVLQMGDQLDSKTLFGGYHGTEIVGQFKWKSSHFTEWLSQPCLMLIEDIDHASPDVVARIVDLFEERKVYLPTGQKIELHDQLCSIATISRKEKHNCLLDCIPIHVTLSPFTNLELQRIVVQTYPRLSPFSRIICKAFRELEKITTNTHSRQLTTTDFLRGCNRISQLEDLTDNMNIFAELIDVWCWSETEPRLTRLCNQLAMLLSISTDQVHTHLKIRKPIIRMEGSFICIGRSRLEQKPSLTVDLKTHLEHTQDVLQLLERISLAVQYQEPVLLVGETGVGKTSVVQALANVVGVSLRVINLNATSDSDELIESYKPTTMAHILEPFTNAFSELFERSFDLSKNKKFFEHIQQCLCNGRFKDYLSIVETSAMKAIEKLKNRNNNNHEQAQWANLIVKARRIRNGLEKNSLMFTLTSGAVKESTTRGDWLLIDEINLASTECLDAIVDAIKNSHQNFRLFACMNPATDAGKRGLPNGVRSKFTEIYVSETTDISQLTQIASGYLPTLRFEHSKALVDFYHDAKLMFPGHFSLRTFCRALLFASDNIFGNLDRSLLEAIKMAFLTNFEPDEKLRMLTKIESVFKTSASVKIEPPDGKEPYIQIEGFWIKQGTEMPQKDENYVLTKTVKQNLAEISRIVCSGRFPILLEGETSAGKTSIVCFLAKITGNKLTRINNHEHTDVQEYIGSYVADFTGRLVFREGPLVCAVREGSWIILDELNLAPTDVIEALNRLLDDNRELYIPELNKTIKAHPSFRLFATQNPAGSYAGRKKLSRALLSRFVVMRFSHLPLDELSSMVCTRCSIHPSASKKLIEVLSELRIRRSLSGLFSARDGLITLRDIFRWAKRLSSDDDETDWLQSMANHGYFLLAGRCRNKRDTESVIETLEKVLKRKIDPQKLCSIDSKYFPKHLQIGGIVLTQDLRRMLVLSYQAWLRKEPILIVGETGGGKTTLAGMIGEGRLLTLNCHERTETADLLGRLRPRSDGGFEWIDGIVIDSMKNGLPLLIDEISLAEDSVLERLNPLFEEQRSLLLTDAGVEAQIVHAKQGFNIIATMNPGGDYGKKELSKALRNRFTEIWSSCEFEKGELLEIFDSRLIQSSLINPFESPSFAAEIIIGWTTDFFGKFGHIFRSAPSVRDIVACSDLYVAARAHGINERNAIFETIQSCFLDSLSSLPSRTSIDLDLVKEEALQMIKDLLHVGHLSIEEPKILVDSHYCRIGPFNLNRGSLSPSSRDDFCFEAPTCISNFYRIARGLLISKPILLEGPPGCGKSSSVMSLARITGHPITRINLSEQTDLSDLFGCDVPILLDDGTLSFKWQDGPILRAIKNQEWILLDEMNLASQSVLEGLNACFDHRHTLYIAEINKTFEIPLGSCVRFFACQNPRTQGGNRRALPKSFLNRFTMIWIDNLTFHDIYKILHKIKRNETITDDTLRAIVKVTEEVSKLENLQGGPFNFNLRDLLRWVDIADYTHDIASAFDTLFVSRMRNKRDKELLQSVFEEKFVKKSSSVPALLTFDADNLRIGNVSLCRPGSKTDLFPLCPSSFILLPSQSTLLYKLSTCARMEWPGLLVGPRNCGKKTTISLLAALAGVQMVTMRLNSETDAQELIGSYEQVIDDSHIIHSKKVLCYLLESFVDPYHTKNIQNADSLLALEAALELALLTNDVSGEILEQARFTLEIAARADIRFAWIDSQFVKAYINGYWIILKDVNLCSAAVLDRLNSCLETEGQLVIAERGDYLPIKRHENFRVFLTMDPINGEISRAMRNRSVEIFLDHSWIETPYDLKAVIEQIAAKKIDFPPEMLNASTGANTRELLHFGTLLKEYEPETAAKLVDLKLSNLSEIAPSKLTCPLSCQILTLETYCRWWFDVCSIISKKDLLAALLIKGLSTSVAALKHDEWVDSPPAKRLKSRLFPKISSIKSTSHSIDPRFNGMRGLETLVDFTISLLQEWCLLELESSSLGSQSALNLSNTLNKYEIATLPFTFKGLPLVSSLMQHIYTFLSGSNLEKMSLMVDEVQITSFILRLLAFASKTREDLDMRFGSAYLYIGWTELQRLSCFTKFIDEFDSFKKFSEIWSLANLEDFVKSFLMKYQRFRAVDSLEDYVACQAFVMTLEQQPSNNEDVLCTTTSEDHDTGTLQLAQQFFDNIESIQKFLVSSTVQESEFSKDFILYRWKSEKFKKMACSSSLLNAIFYKNWKVISMVRSSPFKILAGEFFSSLEYDVSMSTMRVRDLIVYDLRWMHKGFWRLAANALPLQSALSDELLSLHKGVSDWFDIDLPSDATLEDRLSIGLLAMRNSCPPSGTIDPLIFEEAMDRYLQDYFVLIDRPLQSLAQFRQLTTLQTPYCDRDSPHPVISVLWNERTNLEEKMAQRSISSRKIYRQATSEYSALLYEMNSFLQLTEELSKSFRNEHDEYKGIHEMEMIYDRMQSYLHSARSFMNGCLKKYPTFMDVSVTFNLSTMLVVTAVSEFALNMEAKIKKKQLASEFGWPPSLTFVETATGLRSKELEDWAIKETSPLPLRLRAAIICRQIKEDDNPGPLEWVKDQWRKWYEKYVDKAKAKEFMYRDKTQEERENLDQKEFFESNRELQNEVLSTTQLIQLLTDVEEDRAKPPNNEARNYDELFAGIYLENLLINANDFPLSAQWDTLDRDLSILSCFEKQLEGNDRFDVYRESSKKEIKNALFLLQNLRLRTIEVQTRWPEVSSLKLILEAIDAFEMESLSTNQLRLSLRLEDVIGASEEWIKLADRANTIKEELTPIKNLLLEWKKIEIRCWSILLERTQMDSESQALLVAYPLFEKLFSVDLQSNVEQVLIPQVIEWIYHSSLIDYSMRIRTIEILSKWALRRGNNGLAKKLASVAAHFSEFIPSVKDRFNAIRSPIEQTLRDYIHIVKYNDLNLENIKSSSKKAHIQIFKIIKKFKDGCNESVSPLLQNLLRIDEGRQHNCITIPEMTGEAKIKRAYELSTYVLDKVLLHCAEEPFLDFRQRVQGCNELLRSRIVYEGDDKQKEKLQGHEMNRRQRAVAMVIKDAQLLGLNARRATTIDREWLSDRSVTGLGHDPLLPCESMVRAAAAGRSNIIRLALTPNGQIGINTRTHFVGMVEYGLNWQVDVELLYEKSISRLSRFKHINECISVANDNSKEGYFINHGKITAQLPYLLHKASQLCTIFENCLLRCETAPESLDEKTVNLHPLATLHRGHPELVGIKEQLHQILLLAEKIREAFSTLSQNVQEQKLQIYRRLMLEATNLCVSENVVAIQKLLEGLLKWFDLPLHKASIILQSLKDGILISHVPWSEHQFSPKPLLLFVQNFFYEIEDNDDKMKDWKIIDTYGCLSRILCKDIIEITIAQLTSLTEKLALACTVENLEEIYSLSSLCCALLEALISKLSSVLTTFSLSYHRVLSLAEQLLKEGFVNLIPKAELVEKQDGVECEDGGGGGMGEGYGGKDAKDVTDEMEETGQIEGLQDDEPDSNPEDGPSTKNDAPIEMQEDFADELRNIDNDDKDEGEDQNNEDDDQEHNIDDEMGQVETPEEEKLDPKLWDDEREDRDKELDQDNIAADQETSELAAKDDQNSAESGNDKTDPQAPNDEEGDQDIENVDEREIETDSLDADQPECDQMDRSDSPFSNQENNDESNLDGAEISDNEEEPMEKEDFSESIEDRTQSEEQIERPDQHQHDQHEQNEKSLETEKEDITSQVDPLGQGINDAEINREEAIGKEPTEESSADDKTTATQSNKTGENGDGTTSTTFEKLQKENESKNDDEQPDALSEKILKGLGLQDDNIEMDLQEGEGERDDSGDLAKHTEEDSGRQIVTHSSMEEARESKRNALEHRITHPKPLLGRQANDEEGDATEAGDLKEPISKIHLAPEDLYSLAEEITKRLVLGVEADANEKETNAQTFEETIDRKSELEKLWTEIGRSIDVLSSELAENLRLILEPQRATKLQGDYRSGKRLNMRRLIPYIASEYRKDKIWMRRTKKARRDYQVLIAVDDSGSMNEFGMGRVTCESVSIVDEALRKVNAGQVQVVSFGEIVRELRGWSEIGQPGPALLATLKFDQPKTDLIELLTWSARSLANVRTSHSEQLLIIISDGRGALVQGAERVRQALVGLQEVTVLFVILDTGKKSIQEMRVASFENDQVTLTPYLSLFPFKYYAIIESIAQLPSIFSEAIRQWFERSVQLNG